MKSICVDAGFLIGLYDERDEHHQQAQQYFLSFFESTPNRMLIPWPILYETLSTRMVRNRKAMVLLEKDWKRLALQRRLELLSDVELREGIVDECFDQLRNPSLQYRSLSAVDRILRKVVADTNLRIHALLTFNPRDFRDVCERSRCEMHP